MQITTGRAGAVRKYDVLTVLGVIALAGVGPSQRSVLRLITLITARYNWARDELTTGQREIARLWACDERTVKRDMGRFRDLGWLVLRRQGVRGRVAEYGLGIDAIFAASRPHWTSIGPDFALRQEPPIPVAAPRQAPVTAASLPPEGGTTEWALACRAIHDDDPALYAAWLRPMTRTGRAGGCLVLGAPSRFHGTYVDIHLKARLLAACHMADASVRDLRIEA